MNFFKFCALCSNFELVILSLSIGLLQKNDALSLKNKLHVLRTPPPIQLYSENRFYSILIEILKRMENKNETE